MSEALTEIQQGLVMSCMNLAFKMAHQHYLRTRRPHEDCESDAMLGLCRAARSFDPSLGFRYTTHAYQGIRGALSHGYVCWKRTAPERHAATLTPLTDGGEKLRGGLAVFELAWPSHDLTDTGPDDRTTAVIQQALACCFPRERSVIRWRLFTEGKVPSYRECGKRLNLSSQRAVQLYKRGLRRIRDALRRAGIDRADAA